MQFIFILFASVLFLLIVGWPLWFLIYIFLQWRKTKIFPWRKLLIAGLIIILGLFLIKSSSSLFLKGVGENFSPESVKEIRLPDVD